MHLGAIAQWISRLHAWVRPVINAVLSFLWVVTDFPLDFLVVCTVNIIIIRLIYRIESCHSFQTVLFSGFRNISLQSVRIVGRVWNEGSRMLCQRLPSASTATSRLMSQNLPNVSGLIALLVRASHRYREVTGSSPNKIMTFSGFCTQLLKLRS